MHSSYGNHGFKKVATRPSPRPPIPSKTMTMDHEVVVNALNTRARGRGFREKVGRQGTLASREGQGKQRTTLLCAHGLKVAGPSSLRAGKQRRALLCALRHSETHKGTPKPNPNVNARKRKEKNKTTSEDQCGNEECLVQTWESKAA